MHRLQLVAGTALVLAATAPAGAAQGNPLSPIRNKGQTVTPAFEGWYRNADGTISLSFGYFNRNEAEIVDIPVGPNNFVSPGDANRGQPTHFHPRRHWGVFAVVVPASFGERDKVTWTLVVRGDSLSIPGSLKKNWEIDALKGEAGSANTPPDVQFDPAGPKGAGPGGLMGPTLNAKVSAPLTLNVWAHDDGRTPNGISERPVALMWFQHQGAGTVAFSTATPVPDKATGKATTTATFSAPGEYVLRVRANDASGVVGAGHAQCCWSNGFLKVMVTP